MWSGWRRSFLFSMPFVLRSQRSDRPLAPFVLRLASLIFAPSTLRGSAVLDADIASPVSAFRTEAVQSSLRLDPFAPQHTSAKATVDTVEPKAGSRLSFRR